MPRFVRLARPFFLAAILTLSAADLRLGGPVQPVAAAPDAVPAAGSMLVPAGVTWRYLDDGSNQGTAWRAPGFDDSGWASGAAQLGYGDGDETTVVGYGPNADQKYVTTYFRHAFSVADATVYAGLTLSLLRDDGAVVYLNGVEVYRSNMPAGAITHTTFAGYAVGGAEENTFEAVNLGAEQLADGPNVLAVEIHQANPASSDISFDLILLGTSAPAACGGPEVRFAAVGDYGNGSQAEQDVAALVQGWSPDFVITTGDNNYPLGAADTIDAHIGQFYHDFIGNYGGAYGAGAASNRFFPALGNHDWDTGSPQPYAAYFALPGNERYYQFTRGPVEFFVLDSDPREPDGTASASAQAAWLQGALAASTAPWRIVTMHHPPYSSGPHGSTAGMQWSFKTWGATTVMAGHDHSYERLEVGGLTYFVNGLGGADRYPTGSGVAGSQVRYYSDYGAMLVEAGAYCINFRFVTRSGAEVDNYTLAKDLLFVPLIVRP